MRASLRTDDTTCRLGDMPVLTAGLGSTERSVGGRHTDVVNVETTFVTATMGYEYHLALTSGPELLNDVAEQGKWWKHVQRPPLPVL